MNTHKSEKYESDDGPKYRTERPPPRHIAMHPYIRRLPQKERDAFRAAIDGLEAKLDHLRDAVRGVAKGYHNGLFVHGEGGTSKSFTVSKELQRLQAKYVLHNARLTGRGLVDALERARRTSTSSKMPKPCWTIVEVLVSCGLRYGAKAPKSR